MSSRNLGCLTVSAATMTLVLAGCSGSSQTTSANLPPVQQESVVSRAVADSHSGITYINTIGGKFVYGYPRPNKGNAPPVCTLSGFKSLNGGMAVDRSGNLWVPDEGASPKTITEYGPSCGAAKTVLTDVAGALPDNVALDAKGHVYVSNATANGGGPGNIVQYTGTTITATLTDTAIVTPFGLAIDRHNNVWVSYRNNPSQDATSVAEFKGGKMPAELFNNIQLGFPGSLQFDRNQNMLALAGGYPGMYVYAPPYTEGSPTQVLTLNSAPTMCTLDHSQTTLYCTNGFFEQVDVYSYPTATYLYMYDNGLSGLIPQGIANDPTPKN